MNLPAAYHEYRSPLLGLVVGGVVVLLAQIATTLASFCCSPTSFLPRVSAPCVYEVTEGGICIGSVFSDRPQTIPAILRQVGRTHPWVIADLDRCAPCGSSIAIARHSSAIQVSAIFGAKLMAAGKKIDLNRAHPSDLACIPGIGRKTAECIVQERWRRHGFTSVDELRAIRGIGQKRLQVLARWLEVGPWPGSGLTIVDRELPE